MGRGAQPGLFSRKRVHSSRMDWHARERGTPARNHSPAHFRSTGRKHQPLLSDREEKILDGLNVQSLALFIPVHGCLLDIQRANAESVFHDEVTAGFHRVSHQFLEDLIRIHLIIDSDLKKLAGLRIHCGLPQLFRIHLTQTLVSLDVEAFSTLFEDVGKRPFHVFELNGLILSAGDLEPGTSVGAEQLNQSKCFLVFRSRKKRFAEPGFS